VTKRLCAAFDLFRQTFGGTFFLGGNEPLVALPGTIVVVELLSVMPGA
jgi:hypothetical protein